MTVENISWSITTKECWRPGRGGTRNLLITSRHQVHPNEPPRQAGNSVCNVLHHSYTLHSKTSGPSCSKLTTSLVNDSLKFTSSDTQIFWNFLLKNVSSFCSAKATHIFSAKNFRKLYIESAKTVNEMTLKLTMLWTTGPRNGRRLLYEYLGRSSVCVTLHAVNLWSV